MRNKVRNMLRRTAALFLGVSLILTNAVVAMAEAQTAATESPTPTPDPHTPYYHWEVQSNLVENWPQGPEVEAEVAIVMDMDTGAILYSKAIDTPMYPASITKIITGYLASRYLNPEDHFIMTQSAAFGIEPGSSSIYGDMDEEFTVEQALMGLMLESANEMGLILAELVSGNVKKFAELMNATVRNVGGLNSHFNNPHGLPDENHYTTARDMALISKAAWANPVFRSVVTTASYEIPPTNKQPETRYLSNHHKMMEGKERAYEGVLGGKTGYTQAAANTLVTYAQRGDMSVVVVVMHTIDGGYSDTASLLDYTFGNFAHYELPVNENVGQRTFSYNLFQKDDTSAFTFAEKVLVTLPNTVTPEQIQRTTELKRSVILKPRIKSTFSYGNLIVGEWDQLSNQIMSIETFF